MGAFNRMGPMHKTISVIFMLVILPLTGYAKTIDGFITRIDSPSTFHLQSIEVTVAPATVCELKQTTFMPPPPKGWTRDVGITAMSRGYIVPGRCKLNDLSLFTRVHVVGKLQATDKTILAKQIIIYRIVSRSRWLEGGTVLEESPHLSETGQILVGNIWIDGFPMSLSGNTLLSRIQPHSILNFKIKGTQPIPYLQNNPNEGRPSEIPKKGDCAVYRAEHSARGMIRMSSLAYWPDCTSSEELRYTRKCDYDIHPPNYETHRPGLLVYKDSHPIQIVPGENVQKWVLDLGKTLIPTGLPDQALLGINFTFYLVRGFSANIGTFYVEATGSMPIYQLLRWEYDSSTFYSKPQQTAMVRTVVGAPDGTILIPDTVLTQLRSKSELAALISTAITSVIQRQSYHAKPKNMISNAIARASYSYHSDNWEIGSWQTTQALRIGIRQMYLAGYDIREAPFAWAVAQGKPVNNPVINSKDPDKEIPWYAAYAFNYISQYYKDVDYSKLKRGRKEYQQFLQELRKADPGAFASQKADSKPAVKVH